MPGLYARHNRSTCNLIFNIFFQPPAETKVEFFYPAQNDQNAVWYDISLVDGYSLPMEIIPDKQVSLSC